MRHLSYWASQHTRAAIGAIVLLDVVKNVIGIHLGFRFFSALPGMVIEFMAIGVVVAALLLEKNYRRQWQTDSISKDRLYQLRIYSTFWLFIGSFCLSMLLGNRCQQFVNPNSSDFTVRAAANRVGNSVETDAGQVATPSDNIQKTRPLTRRELREERRLVRQKHRQRPAETSTGGYVLLFLLGVGLAFLGAGLACNLSCANHGFAAALVGLLAVGALAGGIYFLIKAFRRKSPKSTALAP